MKVCKFGGSSLSSASQFEKVKKIILSDSERKIIVVSAIGKDKPTDYKITDSLFLTYSHIKYGFDYQPILNKIKERYQEVICDLALDINLDSIFDDLIIKIKNGISENELVSYGEYLSAKIMASYLGFNFVDAKDIIKFNYDGKVCEEKSMKAMEQINIGKGIVIPGFYGEYPNGNICLFSRGGSDVTASYVTKGFKASLYENFTDVDGVMMCDPKIVLNPRLIDKLSYAELRELSYSGASVLHEEAILPLQDYPVDVVILNTNNPSSSGTCISKEVIDKKYLVTGIAGKKDFMSFTFIKKRTSDKLKVMLDVLNILNKYHVPIEHIPSSIDSFSVVLEKTKIKNFYYDLISEFKNIEDIISINEDHDIALISVVGRNMIEKSGTSGRIMHVFGKEKINIKLIAQPREELNIIIGISNLDFNRSILALYNKFALESLE